MIPFDFDYYLPNTVEEAVELFQNLDTEGKNPLYYAGGTEIVSLCRRQLIKPAALIDIKGIEETLVLKKEGGKIIVGANLTLNTFGDQNDYPLLSRVVRSIADRTVRNRLTLGGNICGRLPYREALMPFLLNDAELSIAGPDGRRTEKLSSLFDKRLRLEKAELLLQLSIDENQVELPHWSRRREKHGPIDYPLCHLVALKTNDDQIRLSASGLCAFPFRSIDLENHLNDRSVALKKRVKEAVKILPGKIRDDDRGSAAYRKTVFEFDLEKMLSEMEGS